MDIKDRRTGYVKLTDVSFDTSRRILNFLNRVETQEELIKIVNFDGDSRDSDDKINKHGLKVAQKILEQRRKLGKFRNLEELLNIPRVGPVTLSRIVKEFGSEDVLISSDLERERLEFKAFLLRNPNYFGNLVSSPLKSEKIIESNTKFEELVCLSSNPKLNYVTGIVQIKMEDGYTNSRLRSGTYEYIRLYANLEDKAKLIGTTKFFVFDTPGLKPLTYAVSFDIGQQKIGLPDITRVRAILSWNMRPPADKPDFIPVWGNVLESEVETGQRKCASDSGYSSSIEQLDKLYKDSNVPVARFAYPKFWELLETQFEGNFLNHPLKELGVGIPGVIEEMLGISCNTDYEELMFVGFEPGRNILEGIIKLKQNQGYAGTCYPGSSSEYISFWVWDEITHLWSYMGTSGIEVHDTAELPSGGLYYVVPVPLNARLLPVQNRQLPAKLRILAILSWEISPPTNPDWKPAWGNWLETTIIVPSFSLMPAGAVYFSSIGDIAINDIDTRNIIEINPETDLESSGNGDSGYSIKIAGFITSPPNVLAGESPYKYCVSVRKCIDETPGVWTAWQPLTNSFPVAKTKQDKCDIPVHYDELQSVDSSDNCYTYREQNNLDQWVMVSGNLLAVWEVPRTITGLWEVKLEAKRADGTLLISPEYHNGRLLTQNQVRLRFINNDSDF